MPFGTRGMFRRKDRRVCFEGMSKEAFGEMTFGLASGTGGTFRRTVRQGFRRKLRKEAIGSSFERLRKKGRGLSGTRVIFRRGSEEVYRSAFEGASGGSFEGWPSGMTIIDGLGING